jgi:hypothetical protein
LGWKKVLLEKWAGMQGRGSRPNPVSAHPQASRCIAGTGNIKPSQRAASPRSRQADRRNQKRRERLARSLRAFFRIEGDPLAACGNGWRTRFMIAESGR